MEVHLVNDSAVPACAWVEHYVRQQVVRPWEPSGRNWVWGRININLYHFRNAAACANKYGIISHEMGHVFGLAHVSNRAAVMYSRIAGTSVRWATVDDANGINYLY